MGCNHKAVSSFCLSSEPFHHARPITASLWDTWLPHASFNAKAPTAQLSCQEQGSQRGGRQWAEERLWEVQLKVAAAFRHHTLWRWGVGSQHILPAARWEWRCMVSPPLMKAGRQRDQSCQNHSQSCLRKLSAGLLWALRADGPSSTGLHRGLPASGEYSLQEILCSPHCHLNA